jgi:hypothetical protein
MLAVTTVHYGGGSFQPGGKRFTLVYRGRMLFARKHYSRPCRIAQRTLFAAAALGRLVVWAVARASQRWRTVAERQVVANLETLKLCFRLA